MYLMKQMTDMSVCEIGRHFGNKCPSNVERSIAKLEEHGCKKGVVDLVICELLERTEVMIRRERRRIRKAYCRPM
jgi:chromosomal replication initiation ATPase DnaA